MTEARIRKGGIIAAGEGSRLGGDVPKPLRCVGGRTLLDRALDRLRDGGLESGVLIARDAAVADAARVWADRFEWPLRVLEEATPSSAVSFRRVVEALGPGRAVLTTVDAVLPAGAFDRFLEAAAGRSPSALGLGTTTWVDDEKPLWVDWADDGSVLSLGGTRGRGVTAGLYVVPHELLGEGLDAPPEAPLRTLLGAWVGVGRPAYAIPLPRILDVDRPEDLRAAEAWLRDEGNR